MAKKRTNPNKTVRVDRSHVRNAHVASALETQRQAFIAKFGREPGPGDPVLFDPDATTPVPLSVERLRQETLDAMRAAGTPPQFVYAYKKTGLLLAKGAHVKAAIRAEYEAAIAEYFALEDTRAGKSPE